MIKFTIITVCYNSAKTIDRTILSVLAQTYKNFEYIIVDGFSTDETMQIVKRYEPQFGGRMRWVSEIDTGIYNAMNKGIRMASGDVIGIVNSDDWLEIDALEIVSKVIRQHNMQLSEIYCGWQRFHYKNGGSQIIKTSQKRWDRMARLYRMGLCHPAVYVPTSVYRQFGVFDESFKINADADLMLRCYYGGVKFHFIEKVLSNMLDGGVSNTNHRLGLNDYRNLLRKLSIRKVKYAYLMLLAYSRFLVRTILPNSALHIIRKSRRCVQNKIYHRK